MRHPKSCKSFLDFIGLLLKYLNEKISENVTHTVQLGKCASIPLQEKIRDVYFNTFFYFLLPEITYTLLQSSPQETKILKLFSFMSTLKN